jgi:hypothetical protein
MRNLIAIPIPAERTAGHIAIPGIGVVETEFLCLGVFPLVPIHSLLFLQRGSEYRTIPLPRLVRRSVAFAYLRRWLGCVAAFGAAMVIAVATHPPSAVHLPLIAMLASIPIALVAATWLPFGTARLALAIAESAGVPRHEIEFAQGKLSPHEHAMERANWERQQADQAEASRATYERDRRLLKERRRRSSRTSSPSPPTYDA